MLTLVAGTRVAGHLRFAHRGVAELAPAMKGHNPAFLPKNAGLSREGCSGQSRLDVP